MNKSRSLVCAASLFAVSLIVSCGQAPADEPPTETPVSSTPIPSPTAEDSLARPARVVLVSIDGGGANWIDQWIEDQTMPVLATLVERGVSSRVELPEPPTSAVAHNSLAAGDWPSNTGIVGERLHRFEDSFYWYTSSYDLPMTNAESVWQSASRSGLTTAVLFWPGATPSLSEQIADYTIGYGERVAYSAFHELSFSPAQSWAAVPVSYSPLLESQFQIGDRDSMLTEAFVLTADSTDDGIGSYDTFILSTDRIVDEQDAVLTSRPGRSEERRVGKESRSRWSRYH